MSALAYDQPEQDSGQFSGVETANGSSRHVSPYDPADPVGDDFYGASSKTYTRHPNHSVPSLPSDRPPDYETHESATPLPSFNTTSLVESMNAMRVNDPLPRGASAMSFTPEPVPRAGTSMSMHNPAYRGPYQARYTSTLPSSNATLPLRNRRPPDPRYPVDELALNTDGVNTYTYDDQGSAPASAYPSSDSSYSQHSSPYHPRPPQAGWQGSPVNPAANYGHPGPIHQSPPVPGEYDYLYAAASDVLGMGPQMGSYLPPSAYSSQVSLAPTQPPQYFPPPGPSPYPPGPPGPGSASVSPHGPDPSLPNPSLPQGFDDPEFELRTPATSLQRSGTTASVNLQTRKTKAVDLSAPPYTKEYIDQYRQRIKADPDPEAHFLYAKYLIEAAKKIGADAKDQRAVKKYRDLLIQESLKTIRRLATQNDAYDEAQFFLANCYGTGTLGLQVDHERAYHLYLLAAKQNHAAAAYRVAVCNEIGAGTRREPPRAAAFYRKAASLGDTAAMYKLGMIQLLGSLGEPKNPREAINWLKRAAEQADEENPHALHELAMLHEMPNSQFVVHDPAYAKSLYTQAAHLGYTQSQFKLGQCYEYGILTCPVDPRRSIAWYTKAAEKGNAEAELALSGWYLTGSEGVLKQSDSEAYLWARKAANKGLSKAEYAVGYYAEVGIGIKQDMEFAKRWYMRAAAQGNKRAMNRLTEIKRMGNKRSNVGRPTRQQAKDECVIC
ncbi:hypothetical protein F5I97DRAFT_1848321 [Phlebopus sp. FC_14]|nr:hypothetical protein F5I97DRAFT_1848321 [Phlebopus sp. FC_14]